MFIQDILKYSKDKDEHTVYLRTVLQTLKQHQLHSKYKKCERWLEAYDQFVEAGYTASKKIQLVAYASQQLKSYEKGYVPMIWSEQL